MSDHPLLKEGQFPSILCTELADRIERGEFHEVTIVLDVPNPGYPPIGLTLYDGEDDNALCALVKQLRAADEPGRSMAVEHYSASLYLLCSQVPMNSCPGCGKGPMRTIDFKQGPVDNDYKVYLECDHCDSDVRISSSPLYTEDM